jgi:GTPase Era involved in 16S rRNA processing
MKGDKGRPGGRKVAKGLGTDDEALADKWVGQLNELLASPEFHAVGAEADARKRFDPQVVEIFYEGLDASGTAHRAEREKRIPLPRKGYTWTLLLGITGAGKSTMLRRLIGTDPVSERFPATSINRTTTCDIEVITGGKDYDGVVTFLTQQQTQQEVIESVSAAVLEVVNGGDDGRVMTKLLEQGDMRFRLKYILGDWQDGEGGDEFVFDGESEAEAELGETGAADPEQMDKCLRGLLGRIRHVGGEARKAVELLLGDLDSLAGEDRNYALEEIQEEAEQSDGFLDLVSDVMAEIRARFEVATEGEYLRTSTGWPTAWTLRMPAARRKDFLQAMRWFSGNTKGQWGRLLTPLVTGLRVKGPFRPSWAEGNYEHVIIDTEGLLHAKTSSDVPVELTTLFKGVDTVLLVESAKNALHSPVAAKVFEAVATTGYTAKFALAFTHMDQAKGDDLRDGRAKKEKVFGGARNILENEVAKSAGRDAARHLEAHLRTNTFYFGYLDATKYPRKDEAAIAKFEKVIAEQLRELALSMASRTQPDLKLPAYPRYSMKHLALGVREASLSFIETWDALLGFRYSEKTDAAPWQSIKAMSRRYAEGWLWDGFWLSPIDNLTAGLRRVLTKFIDSPIDWGGKPVSDEQKRAILDGLKQQVSDLLPAMAEERLRKLPLPDWQEAYALRLKGSTVLRRQRVRTIFQTQIPVPEFVGDRVSLMWMEQIEKLVEDVVEKLKLKAEVIAAELEKR